MNNFRSFMNDIPPNDISISILCTDTKLLLSTLLNAPKVLPNENDIPRDWRGLAHLIGLGHDEIYSNDPNPTEKVLNLWQKQSIAYTIQKLVEFLETIDRYDVIDDARKLIEKDINYYFEARSETVRKPKSIDCIDEKILTVHDAERLSQGLGPQMYDAFVAFSFDDYEFATELINRMENEYGLKLCERERDLVAGFQFEFSALIELISKRCNYLIAVLSPSFFNNPVDKFLINYAQAVGIEQNCRKIIPCVYRHCDMPPELENIYCLDYERLAHRINFWEKLSSSIATKPAIKSHDITKSKKLSTSSNTFKKVSDTSERNKFLRPIITIKKYVSTRDLTLAGFKKSPKNISTPDLAVVEAMNHSATSKNLTEKKTSIIPKFLRTSKKSEKKVQVKEKDKKKSKVKMLVPA